MHDPALAQAGPPDSPQWRTGYPRCFFGQKAERPQEVLPIEEPGQLGVTGAGHLDTPGHHA